MAAIKDAIFLTFKGQMKGLITLNKFRLLGGRGIILTILKFSQIHTNSFFKRQKNKTEYLESIFAFSKIDNTYLLTYPEQKTSE